MVKNNKRSMMPVQGGVRKNRTRMPQTQGSVIRYSASQGNFPTVSLGGSTGAVRHYIPGFSAPLANTVGPGIVGYYSSAKFLPGTSIRWEPSVSFTTTGRVFVGFTDNPEVAVALSALYSAAVVSGLNADWAAYGNQLKALGSLKSFPVWQETEVSFPTVLRRKRFDCNENVATAAVDIFDRCAQQNMYVYIEGLNITGNPGSFWFHDVVDVEGVHGTAT